MTVIGLDCAESKQTATIKFVIFFHRLVFFLLFFRPLFAFDFVPLFSYVVPGSVEIYEGAYGQGALTMGAALGFNANLNSKQESEPKLFVTETTDGESTTTVLQKGSLELDASGMALSGTRLMSAYNSYRLRGGHEEPYTDILLAPFDPEQLFRPVTVASLLIAGGLLLRANDDYKYQWQGNVSRGDMNAYVFSRLSFAPAVSEEMFFRGYLNTELSKSFGPVIGIGLSSLAFAAVHEGVGIQADALMAGMAGLGLATLQVSNDYKISQGVALHFWINFLVGLKAIENGGRADNLLSFALLF